MIRVVLPQHLQRLARIDGELQLEVRDPVTVSTVMDALERDYPMLCGTIREHVTYKRRSRVRFFAASVDITHQPVDTRLPESIVNGAEPLLIIGAIAGG